jgi:hypothetical protein
MMLTCTALAVGSRHPATVTLFCFSRRGLPDLGFHAKKWATLVEWAQEALAVAGLLCRTIKTWSLPARWDYDYLEFYTGKQVCMGGTCLIRCPASEHARWFFFLLGVKFSPVTVTVLCNVRPALLVRLARAGCPAWDWQGCYWTWDQDWVPSLS